MKQKLKSKHFIKLVIAIMIIAISIFMLTKPVEGYEIRYISYRDYDEAIEQSFDDINDVTNARGWNTWYQALCVHPGAVNTLDEDIELYLMIDINPDGNNPTGGTYTAKTRVNGRVEIVTGTLKPNRTNAAVAYIAYYAEQYSKEHGPSIANTEDSIAQVNYPFNDYCNQCGYEDYLNRLTSYYSLPPASYEEIGGSWMAREEYQNCIVPADDYARNWESATKTYQARICFFKNTCINYGYTGQDFIIMWGKEIEKPKIQIDKYITQVEHEGDIYITPIDVYGTERANKTDDDKKENPARAYTNSTVTYEILLKNNSTNDIEGEFYDDFNVENDNCFEFLEGTLQYETKDDYGNISTKIINLVDEGGKTKKEKIKILAGREARVTLKLKLVVKPKEGTLYENKGIFIYTDEEEEHSSDFVTLILKTPEVTINKYVKTINSASFSRSTMTEDEKAVSPADAGVENEAKLIDYIIEIKYKYEEGLRPIELTMKDTCQTEGLEKGACSPPEGRITIRPGETIRYSLQALIFADNAKPGIYVNTAEMEFEYDNIAYEEHSSDYVKINPAPPTDDSPSGHVKKYISAISKGNAPDEEYGNFIEAANRSNMSKSAKEQAPVEVVKGTYVTYTIKVYNDVWYQNTSTYACQVGLCYHYNWHFLDWLTCVDTFGEGLKFVSATNCVGQEDGGYKFKWNHVDYGTWSTATITLEVTASNMTLENLWNQVTDVKWQYTRYDCKTVHHYVIVGYTKDGHPLYKHTPPCSHRHPHYEVTGTLDGLDRDYVRLLDPYVRGTVWVDQNEDGYRQNDENIQQLIKENYNNIRVRLWKSDGTLIATKTIDSSGKYDFGRVRKGSVKTGPDSSKDYWYGNEPEGVSPDRLEWQKFNYNSASLVTYYITFEYNGERYEATPKDVSITVRESGSYTIDSNAKDQDRDTFNESLQTISYNRAYWTIDGTDGDTEKGGKPLAYKTSAPSSEELQTSTLIWDGNNLDNPSSDWASNYHSKTGSDRSITMIAKTDTFFFDSGDIKYLKYIDFGIYRREDSANLTATKDVVSAEVTINGHQTIYNYENLDKEPYVATKTNVLSKPYLLMIYREDYEFRTEYYANGDLIKLINRNNPYTDMGRDNDLQVILTYKIKVTNKSDEASGLVAVVRELVDYYSKDEMTLIKEMITLGKDGEPVDAYPESKYSNELHDDSKVYTQMFLGGEALNNTSLKPGESLEIYIKYRVEKDADGYLLLDDIDDSTEDSKMNIVEIGAYSFYTPDGKPAGLVDKNSNPGNIEFKDGGTGKADTDKFEDDSFETGILVVLREHVPGPIEKKYYYRNISGVVFEEVNPTISVDNQLVGDGKKNNSDVWVPNALVKLYEVIQKRDVGGEVLEEFYVDTGLSTRTDAEGKYNFDHDIHAGFYTVRFIYGDEADYFDVGDGNTIKYSGQDYQSTKYMDIATSEGASNYLVKKSPSDYEAQIYSAAIFAQISNNHEEFAIDPTTHKMYVPYASGGDTQPIYSLAKDNEVRRLEVNEYSTTMTYLMDTILKAGKDDPVGANKNTDEARLLAEHTAMYGDTRTFDMDIEYYDKYDEIKEDTKIIYVIRDGEVRTEKISNFYYSVRDVNFGVIERPQTKLQLMKDITEIKAVTSDGNTLIDIFFDVEYTRNADGSIDHKSVLNKEISIGYTEVQALNRNEENQGFRYANIDTELLQGMRITVKYRIAVANISEVDHLAEWFETAMKTSDVRLTVDYSGAPATEEGDHIIIDSIDGQTRTYNYEKSYIYQLLYVGNDITDPLTTAHTGEYTYHDCVPIGPETVRTRYTYNNIKNKAQSNYKTGYYLGNIYYYNAESFKESKVETRVDQYIDYVDNDLVFKAEENLNEKGQTTHLTYTTADIASKGLLRDIKSGDDYISDGAKYYYNPKQPNVNNNLAFNIEDNEINKNFYRYLEPLVEKAGDSISQEKLYTIDLEASKILTSEMDVEGMIVDNIAEIVKVSNTAGRKINVKVGNDVTGYIGNTTKRPIESINDLTIPSDKRPSLVTISNKESDTDFTEYVTFSPPTGLTEPQAVIKTIIDKTGDILLIAIPVAIIIVGMTYVTVQMVRRKKFYK